MKSGKFIAVTTYNDAMCYVRSWFGNKRYHMKLLLHTLAKAKGLSGKFSKKNLQVFFAA